MRSSHTDTGATEFREASYGDYHQINITGSKGVNEGKDIDGGRQGEWCLDHTVGSRGDLVRIAVDYLDWYSRVCEANLFVRAGAISETELRKE